MIDSVDREILLILQENARTSNAEIGRRVGLTASAVLERIKKLERGGVVEGYRAVVSPRPFGLSLLVFVSVRLGTMSGASRTGEEIAAMEGVEELYRMAGEDCFLAKVRCADTDALVPILERINDLEAVAGTRTNVALGAPKEGCGVRIPETSGE